ncbi:CMP-N-acetylneuraminic acid synthetase [Desulfamplus magnetovallimortis]|uniref:CMP-N-acetylneuraminic acid synthetase n=1 Tax=Desulfamplus magnetovallimortis TaxID=1246637 RepID=A0A1W1HEQ9_9BACT|nr:acylneuraminate cytidylyltransferase family protein [Desulfamplus magnetovallimortis]SLM30979.1 CMP-N-acetylneuraminic acid synthetase [Desulfamplus magnetovallimortis]
MSNHNLKSSLQVTALITARGGSKGVPKKNIRPLAGKPLIAWTIEAALKSKNIERVIVSTDDPEIAEISNQYGADTPFIRPSLIAKDDTPHIDVLIHALEWLKTHENYSPDYILTLQPTSPLRTSNDIDGAINLLHRYKKTNNTNNIDYEEKIDAVIGICEASNHPYIVHSINKKGYLEPFIDKKPSYLRRQDFPSAYVINGAIYLNQVSSLMALKTMFPPKSIGYVMPRERSLDIDELWEFIVAEALIIHKSNYEK